MYSYQLASFLLLAASILLWAQQPRQLHSYKLKEKTRKTKKKNLFFLNSEVGVKREWLIIKIENII